MSKLRGGTAVVGIGQTPYYKRGTSPDSDVKLALRAIVGACEDAGFDPRDVDGFVSYASERSDAPRMMAALGTREVRFAALTWIHGGGIPGSLSLAAAAILTGQAEAVVVYRSMAERVGQRLRVNVARADSGSALPAIDGGGRSSSIRAAGGHSGLLLSRAQQPAGSGSKYRHG
jgi:hypothetical protein